MSIEGPCGRAATWTTGTRQTRRFQPRNGKPIFPRQKRESDYARLQPATYAAFVMPVSRLRGALVHGFGTFSERPLIVDSTRLSIVGEGEWAAVKHGGRDRRGWRKLHLGVDQSGMVVAQAITAATVDDGTTGITLNRGCRRQPQKCDGGCPTIPPVRVARPLWPRRRARPTCLDADRGRVRVIARSRRS